MAERSAGHAAWEAGRPAASTPPTLARLCVRVINEALHAIGRDPGGLGEALVRGQGSSFVLLACLLPLAQLKELLALAVLPEAGADAGTSASYPPSAAAMLLSALSASSPTFVQDADVTLNPGRMASRGAPVLGALTNLRRVRVRVEEENDVERQRGRAGSPEKRANVRGVAEVLAVLSSLPRLSVLDLSHSSCWRMMSTGSIAARLPVTLTALDLSGTRAGDSAIAHLCLPHLRWLSLASLIGVTDTAMRYLSRPVQGSREHAMSRLAFLTLVGTGVSADGVIALLTRMPSLRVVDAPEEACGTRALQRALRNQHAPSGIASKFGGTCVGSAFPRPPALLSDVGSRHVIPASDIDGDELSGGWGYMSVARLLRECCKSPANSTGTSSPSAARGGICLDRHSGTKPGAPSSRAWIHRDTLRLLCTEALDAEEGDCGSGIPAGGAERENAGGVDLASGTAEGGAPKRRRIKLPFVSKGR